MANVNNKYEFDSRIFLGDQCAIRVKDVKLVHIGEFQVDIGKGVIGDPVHIDLDIAGKAQATALSTCPMEPNGMGRQVTFSTGIGDGIYPVIASVGEVEKFGDRIIELHVDFTHPLRGKGCQKPFPHPWTDECYFCTEIHEQPASRKLTRKKIEPSVSLEARPDAKLKQELGFRVHRLGTERS